MYQNFIIPYLYEAQRVLGDTPPIIRNLKLHWQPLVLHTWRVVGHVVGGRCQAHTVQLYSFFNLGTRGRWGGVGSQSHSRATLTLGKDTQYPFCGRLGGPQDQSGQLQKISPPTRI
jgi:hypothetical protein